MSNPEELAKLLEVLEVNLETVKPQERNKKLSEKDDYKKTLEKLTVKAVRMYVKETFYGEILGIRIEQQEPGFPFPPNVFAITPNGEVRIDYELQDESHPTIAELEALSADFNFEFGEDEDQINIMMSSLEKSLIKSLSSTKWGDNA